MHKLFLTGAFSFWARTTAVSVTLPSHTSMLTGVVPDRHGITWNRDLKFKEPVYPLVPTIFELAHRAGYTTGMATGKSKFSVLNKPGTLDWVSIPNVAHTTDGDVATEACKIIAEHQPQVMFVHFPGPDNAGHLKGWGTEGRASGGRGIRRRPGPRAGGIGRG